MLCSAQRLVAGVGLPAVAVDEGSVPLGSWEATLFPGLSITGEEAMAHPLCPPEPFIQG